MSCRIEEAGSPTRTQAAVWNASEEWKRLTARVKELELVCVHTHTPHTHTHAHTASHTHTRTHTHTHTHTHKHCILFVALSLPSCPDIKRDLSMDGLAPQEKAKLESVPQMRKKRERRCTGGESCAECGTHMLYQWAHPQYKVLLKCCALQ